jgi:hypothetical protein
LDRLPGKPDWETATDGTDVAPPTCPKPPI